MWFKHFTVAALLVGASAAQAVTVFTDNFNANTPGQNLTPVGWTITGTNASVDTLGPGYFDLLPGNGSYVDLVGSTGGSGVFSRSFSVTAGLTYTAIFSLAGSNRNFAETVNVSFGSASASYAFAINDPFSIKTLTFTATASGTQSLSFTNVGLSPVEGALLDNVTVSSVPEPGSYALMLAGLGAAGFIARRRRQI